MLTAERAREMVDYDPETGVFRRRIALRGKRAGAIVGHVDAIKGYRRMQVDGHNCRAHRLAWLIAYGEWPMGDIDHIDGNRDNNAIANLRLASSMQNAANRRRSARNKSGFKGVVARDGGWRAQIRRNGRFISLGTHPTKEQASAAYIAAAAAHDGQFLCTNPNGGA